MVCNFADVSSDMKHSKLWPCECPLLEQLRILADSLHMSRSSMTDSVQFGVQIFPYKGVVAQFGAFIVLCGLTHVMNIWTFEASAADATRTMTFFKVTTAFVSCATAVTLTWVIPEILSVKKNELYLVKKVISILCNS